MALRFNHSEETAWATGPIVEARPFRSLHPCAEVRPFCKVRSHAEYLRQVDRCSYLSLIAERHDGWADDSPGKMACTIGCGYSRPMSPAEVQDKEMRATARRSAVRKATATDGGRQSTMEAYPAE